MNTEIDKYNFLVQLINVFQRVNQLSWSADQTKKRYPSPEAMTETELENLTKVYVVLGEEIEKINKEWKRIKKTYEY